MSEEGIPESPGPEAGAESEPTSDHGNYHDRIRTDTDFAVEEVQKKDRYINELHQKYNGLKGLEQYVQAAGGTEELIQLAIEGNTARQQATQPTPPEQTSPEIPDDDRFIDSEVRELNDDVKQKLAERDRVINELQQRLNVAETNGLKGSLQENMEKALTRFSEDEELLKEAQEKIMGAVATSERAARNGDRSAVQSLEQLAGPQGEQTLRMMTMDIYDRWVEKQLGGATQTPPNGGAMSMSTDSPSTTRAGLQTEAVTVKPGVRVDQNVVREALRNAAIKMGKDPDKLFG